MTEQPWAVWGSGAWWKRRTWRIVKNSPTWTWYAMRGEIGPWETRVWLGGIVYLLGRVSGAW